MLILTRRVGEELIIGDEVSVTVLGVKGNQVRVGIEAPDDISIHRREVYERIQAQREIDSQNEMKNENKKENIVESILRDVLKCTRKELTSRKS